MEQPDYVRRHFEETLPQYTEVCQGTCLWFCCVHLLYHVAQATPTTLLIIFQLSKSKELGREMSLKLVDDFEEKCRKKINTSSLEFGPKEFDEGKISRPIGKGG